MLSVTYLTIYSTYYQYYLQRQRSHPVFTANTNPAHWICKDSRDLIAAETEGFLGAVTMSQSHHYFNHKHNITEPAINLDTQLADNLLTYMKAYILRKHSQTNKTV